MDGVDFTLLPGDPLYVTHTENENTLDFVIRDRYGNEVNTNMTGTLRLNDQSVQSITFSDGKYTTSKQSGFYLIQVPDLALSTVEYSDTDGKHEIHGFPSYATYIQ